VVTVVNDMSQVDQLQRLAIEFASLSKELSAGADAGSALEGIARISLKTIDGARWVSITTLEKSRPVTVARTDDFAQRIDDLQYGLAEGPCLQAIEDDEAFFTPDLRADHRWSRFAADAIAAGVFGVLSARLHLANDRRGSLNVYAAEPGALSASSVGVGSILTSHAEVALTALDASERVQHLQRALESNRQIGVAIGILMAQHSYSREDAFEALRTASQHLHRKLSAIAADVTYAGELPRFGRCKNI
jgi:hypothetical protein